MRTHRESAAEYDSRRGSARERGYSARWDKAARLYLAAHPLCLGCAAAGRIEPAVLVDHIEPHKGNEARFWDAGNWQPLCRWHHDSVKQRLENMWQRHQVGVSALRIDSPAALALTSDMRRD